jgi:protein-L-isoaspartate(D-aspartate) O-methyltransferase
LGKWLTLYRLFIPVDDEIGYSQHIWVVDKDEKGEVTRKKLYPVAYVPLTDAPTSL